MGQQERKARQARIDTLRAQCQRLSNERARLETINEREDAAPWMSACFRYLNRSSDNRTWWMYLRIIAHNGGNSFRVLKCESQAGGWHIACEESYYLLPDPKGRGFVRITRRQFDAAWRRHVKRIEALNAR